jgi:uncharacterized protein (UPF0332 family)
MTDRERLFNYRLNQAEETLVEAEKMLADGYSSRTIVNRAYYALFYATLALFLRLEIDGKTSKHAGVIALFDREVVKPGKMEVRFSRILHRLFELRQRADYKELVEIAPEDAMLAVKDSREFLAAARAVVEAKET